MASELNINTQFLKNLESANNHLQNIVQTTEKATKAFKDLVSGTSAFDVLAKIQAGLAKMSGQKVKVDIEAKGLEELSSGMSDTIKQVQILKNAELFDNSKLNKTAEIIFSIEKKLADTQTKMDELRKKWNILSEGKQYTKTQNGIEPLDFVEPTNDKGRKIRKDSNVYKQIKAEYDLKVKLLKEEVEAEVRQQIELQAIQKKQLEWAKMTMAERAEYVQKELSKILKEEQKNINEVRKLYSGYISEMNSLSSKINKNEGKNEDGALTEQINIQKSRYMQLDALRRELEEGYGAYIVDIAEKANARAADITAARLRKEADAKKEAEKEALEKYRSSAEGALKLASDASTINEMKEAQKYLQIARGNVDVKDTEAIKKLNDEYTRLRMTIESLTTAEKNEQTLQPTLKNEYARLLVELDKVAEAKERASKTQAFKDNNLAAQQEMNSLIEREKDIREKMSQIEKAAVIKSKERIKLEKELAEWTAKRANYERNTNASDISDARSGKGTQAAKDFLSADSKVAELQAKLNAVEENESALDDIIRKHEANRAMASIALTEKTEAKKAEIALKKILKQQELRRKTATRSTARANQIIDESENAKNVAQEEEAIKRLEDARRRLNKNDADYYETLERLNQKIDEHTHNIKMATDAQYRENHAKEEARKRNTTFEGAMEYSKNIQSINEQIQALKYLKEARANLNKNVLGEEEYRRQVSAITEEIKQQEKELDSLTGKTQETNSVMSQLANRIVAAFSINAISNYVEKIATIRGEFELQKKALTAIIQDQRQANVLWEKTVALAVKSPFRVKELVTYTKQLAAYRVESDKLYDTTKMLADISAGLGVDMDRLILAYGQVKAANYLRGTELRQFSEAGVNILQELSTYYEKTRGVAVSVAEVFDMVSKRKVAFEDVHAVLQNLTSAGGMFFEMQEKQASTLQGQISNLRDAYELMLNDIGKENDGLLKGGVMLARTLISNWKAISTVAVPAIEIIAVGMAAFKIRTLAASKNMAGMVAHMKSFGILLTQGQAKMKAFAAAAQINPFGAWAIAIGIFVAAISGVVTQIMKIREAYKKINDEQAESEKQIKTIHAKFIKASGEKEPYKAQREALHEIVSLAKEKYQMKIDVEVDKLKVEELGKKMSEITQQMLIDESYISEFKKAFADREENRFNPLGHEIVKDLKQYQEAEQTLKNLILTNLNTVISTATLNYEKLNEAQRKALESLKKEKLDTETDEQYIKRLQDAYTLLYSQTHQLIESTNEALRHEQNTDIRSRLRQVHDEAEALHSQLFGNTDDWDDAFSGLAESSTEAQKEVEALMNTVKGLDGLTKDDKERIIQLMVKTTLDSRELQGVENKMLYWIENWNNNSPSIKVKIDFTPDDPMGMNNIILPDWAENYNKMFEGYHGFLRANASTDKDTIIAHLREEWGKLNEEIERYEKSTEKEKLYSGVDISSLKTNIAEVQKQLDAFGVDYTKKTTGDGTQKNWFVEMAKSIRDTHNDFVTFHKDLEKSKALAAALDKNKDVFAEAAKNAGVDLTLENFTEGFDKEEGVLDMLAKILDNIPEKSKNARYEVEKLIRTIKGETDVTDAQKEAERITGEIEQMFDHYEISLELEKLNIPKDMAKQFFGVDSIDLSKIRTEILKMVDMGSFAKQTNLQIFNSKEFQNLSKEQQNIVRKFLEQVSDMETKAQQERLKTYLQYARDAVSERAKIKLEEMRKLQEIERTFTEPEQEPEKQKARDKVKQDSEQELKKLEWEEFQKSDTFVRLFKDLDNASSILINHSIDKLKEFKEQWKDMPVEDMKSIVDKINQLELKLAEIKPFGGTNYKDLMREMEKKAQFDSSDAQKFADKGKYKQAFEQEGIFQEEAIQRSAQYIADLEAVIRLKQESNNIDGENLNLTESQVNLSTLSIEQLNDMLATEKKLKDNAGEKLANSNEYTLLLNKQQKKLQAQATAIESAQKMANDLYNEFSNLADALGAGDGPGRIFADMGMQMMNTVLNTLMLQAQLQAATIAAEGLGTALNTAMGVVGWIVMAVQLIAQGFMAIFKAHDNRLQEQIEKLEDDVEVLEKKFEKLEKAMNDAFSLDLLKGNGDAAIDNLDEQIAKTKQMIALEEQKKDTDDEKIKEWKKEIEEMQEQQEELRQQMVSIATGGIFDSVRDAASEFTDAWLEAYKETGDGMKGLEDSFQEMLQNMLKQQATMLITGKFLDSWKKELDKYVHADDLHLTTEEAKTWVSKIKNDLPALSEALEAYFKSMEEAGVDLTGGDGELTGLQKGIQGVTEDTAQIIEGYLNSIRFFSAEKYRILSEFISSFSNQEIENPIVSQLKIIATQTANIYELLRDLIAPHNTQDGRGLKVIM